MQSIEAQILLAFLQTCPKWYFLSFNNSQWSKIEINGFSKHFRCVAFSKNFQLQYVMLGKKKHIVLLSMESSNSICFREFLSEPIMRLLLPYHSYISLEVFSCFSFWACDNKKILSAMKLKPRKVHHLLPRFHHKTLIWLPRCLSRNSTGYILLLDSRVDQSSRLRSIVQKSVKLFKSAVLYLCRHLITLSMLF